MRRDYHLPPDTRNAAVSNPKHNLSKGLLNCEDKLMRLNDIHLVLLVEHTVMIEQEKEIKVEATLSPSLQHGASVCVKQKMFLIHL